MSHTIPLYHRGLKWWQQLTEQFSRLWVVWVEIQIHCVITNQLCWPVISWRLRQLWHFQKHTLWSDPLCASSLWKRRHAHARQKTFPETNSCLKVASRPQFFSPTEKGATPGAPAAISACESVCCSCTAKHCLSEELQNRKWLSYTNL